MRPRKRASKQSTALRRDQIAEAALAIMARRGLRGLSIGALARHVGLVPSGIYRHYPGKAAVLDAVLDHLDDRLTANVDAARRASPQPLARLKLLLDRHVGLLERDTAIPLIVFSEQVYGGPARRRARLARVILDYLERIADICRDGQRRGLIRKDVPAPTLSVMFLGLVQPGIIIRHLTQGEFDLRGHAARAWRLFRECAAAGTGEEKKRREP